MNLFGLMETSGSAMPRPSACAQRWLRQTWPTRRPRAHLVQAVRITGSTCSLPPTARIRLLRIRFRTRLLRPSGLSCSTHRAARSRPAACTSPKSSKIFAPPLKRYDPGHPDAGPDGYVAYPDINPLTEMVDLMGATRAYGLNGSAVQAEKGMIEEARPWRSPSRRHISARQAQRRIRS